MKKKIYLAGEMDDKWREEFIGYITSAFHPCILSEIEFVSPKRIIGDKHDSNTANECVDRDLSLIKESDYVIAYLNREGLYGTIVEIIHCFIIKKPISIIVETYLNPSHQGEEYSVVGSNGEFPYISPYWFLLEYKLKNQNKFYEHNHLGIYEGMNWENMEHIIQYDIFDATLKKNSEFVRGEDALLEDLKDLDSGYTKTTILNRFKRNFLMVKELKEKFNKCQICNFTFKKKDGVNYNETHHIIPLSQNGKDQEINTLILCANCHRQLHYADVDISNILKRTLIINGEVKIIQK